MKLRIYLLILSGFLLLASCQKEKSGLQAPEIIVVSADIERVEPPNWWVGFKHQELQLLVKHPNIGSAKASISYSGVYVLFRMELL